MWGSCLGFLWGLSLIYKNSFWNSHVTDQGFFCSKMFPAKPESEADHHSVSCAQPLTYKTLLFLCLLEQQ